MGAASVTLEPDIRESLKFEASLGHIGCKHVPNTHIHACTCARAHTHTRMHHTRNENNAYEIMPMSGWGLTQEGEREG